MDQIKSFSLLVRCETLLSVGLQQPVLLEALCWYFFFIFVQLFAEQLVLLLTLFLHRPILAPLLSLALKNFSLLRNY